MRKITVNQDVLKNPPQGKKQFYLWIIFAAICISRVIYLLVIFPSDSIGTCPELHAFPDKAMLNHSTTTDTNDFHGSCYFSDNYQDATKLFLKSAQLCNATISKHYIDENLFITVAIIEGSSEKFLVHLSGTHGVEAYAGSAIQSAALQYLAINNLCSVIENDISHNHTDRPTVVFVHAVNPYVSIFPIKKSFAASLLT